MKNPNGYGCVYKLSGKRRKPFAVRTTDSWVIDEKTSKTKQKYKNIGYYTTRKEAMTALAQYNENPYDLDVGKVTFSEIYEKWSKEKFDKISQSNVNGYKASYALCENIYNMRFADIKKNHLQNIVDTCGKNYPTLRKLKVLYNQIFQYAMENDVISKDYSKYVDIAQYNKGTEKKQPFAEKEIKNIWNNVERNEYLQIPLMLIYSGLRISEMLDLRKENVYLDERYFEVVESKTQAGIRKVPISKRTIAFFKYWINKNDCEYLLSTPEGKHFTYRNYYDSYWKPFQKELKMKHKPHDTRHTTVSLLAKAKVDQTTIKIIVGHAGAMTLTERVYTHLEVEQLINAIDLI